MAIDAPGVFQFSLVADTDMSNLTRFQFTAVSVATAKNVAGEGQGSASMISCDGSQAFVGVLQSNPIAGEAGTVMLRGLSRVQCGTAWKVGDALGVDANGRFQPAGSGAAVGVAFESAVPGDISTMLIR